MYTAHKWKVIYGIFCSLLKIVNYGYVYFLKQFDLQNFKNEHFYWKRKLKTIEGSNDPKYLKKNI